MNTQDVVIQVFAELTRYPLDILTPQAELEAELGIDSVKRTEIISALQQRFGLPTDLMPPQRLNTIAEVAAFVESARNGTLSASPAAEPAPAPVAAPEPEPAFSDGIGWANAAPALSVAPAPRPAPVANHVQTRAPAPAPVYAPPPPSAPAMSAGADGVRREVLSVLHEVTGEAMRRLGSPTHMNGISHERRDQPRPQRPPSWLSESQRPLAGKVTLVTGSGRSLGKTIALRLAALGARVIVNSFHSRDAGEATAAEIRDRGGEAVHIWGSMARRDHIERLFAEIESRFGHLDYFISNASNGIIAPLDQITEDHWDRSFKTNVVGLHRGAMLAAPLMARRGGGRILTISSPGADRYIEHFGCQGPVKAALESLVRYLAVELGPQNIQVNALSAGPIYGSLLNHYPDAERLIPYWESRTPNGQLATEDDIAEAVVWLLSPAVNSFSGATLLAANTGSLRI